MYVLLTDEETSASVVATHFVRNCQALSPLLTAAGENLFAMPVGHAFAKAVLVAAFAI